MALIEKLRAKLRQGLFLKWLFDRLKHLGFEFVPYHLLLEGCSPAAEQRILQDNPQDYRFCLARADGMQAFDRLDGRNETAAALAKRIEAGQLCFVADRDGKPAAFSWANLEEIDWAPAHLLLRGHEAYLYDMHTSKAFRGQNIAARLRAQSYEELRRQGRHRFYSISECFNRSSLRFKQKLGARILKTILYIRLPGGVHRQFLLHDNARLLPQGKPILVSE